MCVYAVCVRVCVCVCVIAFGVHVLQDEMPISSQTCSIFCYLPNLATLPRRGGRCVSNDTATYECLQSMCNRYLIAEQRLCIGDSSLSSRELHRNMYLEEHET